MVLRGLAVAVGLNEAIVLQQVFWLLQDTRNGAEHDGHRWLYNTYEEWRENFFPFWSERTLRRVFDQLETMNLLVSCQPEGRSSRRKWYRINQGMLQQLTEERIPEAANLATSKRPKRTLPYYKEDSSKKSLSKETPEVSGVAVVYEAKWKPTTKTKEQQLRSIRPRADYPSEDQFNAFLHANDIYDLFADYRPDLYGELCTHKWHQWKEGGRKWVPINDWQRYVTALSEKIENV